jgi:GH15 family glucan-1,4-alpha-glucosidase
MTPIKNYFLIGDFHTAALVSQNGSIDWLCLPKFDSESIFASILDKNGGSFSVKNNGYYIKSKYSENTAVVEHHFSNDNNEFTLEDFMLPRPVKECYKHFLVRKLRGVKGVNLIEFNFNPCPGYAKREADIHKEYGKLIFYNDDDKVILSLPKEMQKKKTENGYDLSIRLSEGEEKEIVMEYISAGNKTAFGKKDFADETYSYWNEWVKDKNFGVFKKAEMIRSTITLKLLQYYPTGAIVAAPTTSLPCEIGGVRNWDYRYTWIRDATFTLYAFYVTGCKEEANRFFDFISLVAKDVAKKDFHLKLMYTIDGKESFDEIYPDHLSGYENSKPVRIGNNATDQFQLDVYGTLIDAHYFMSKTEIEIAELDRDLLIYLADEIKKRWKTEDHGIWEMRGKVFHYTYSKVMAWVGIDRMIKLADEIDLEKEKVEEYKKLRDEIYNWVWENCYNEELQNFTQHPGCEDVDASNIFFVLVQFLDKKDERTKKIINNTCKKLSEKEVFVYRYLLDDGLEGMDNAFVLCTFWLISAWAILEDTDKALYLYEKFRSHVDESGLMSEQMKADNGKYRGNFPQGFSHLGDVMSIHYLNKYISRKKKNHGEAN